MNKKTHYIFLVVLVSILALGLILLQFPRTAPSQPTQSQAQFNVWVNEAIITTYLYDYKNYEQQQKIMSKYFSSRGWIAYTKALTDSKLLDSVKANAYTVSAVATQPPHISAKGNSHWQASMPVLVVYKNNQFQQQQNLQVSIEFSAAPSGQGVRGWMIDSFRTTEITPPCQCK